MKFEDKVIRLHLSIGFAGVDQKDEHKLSDYFTEDEWNTLNEKEQQKELDEISDEWASNYIDCSASVDE